MIDHSFDFKPLNMRLIEATSVRKQLQQIGILMDETIRTKLMMASNEFVKNGSSCTLRLRVGDKASAIVQFRGNPSQQSGVTLEYL